MKMKFIEQSIRETLAVSHQLDVERNISHFKISSKRRWERPDHYKDGWKMHGQQVTLINIQRRAPASKSFPAWVSLRAEWSKQEPGCEMRPAHAHQAEMIGKASGVSTDCHRATKPITNGIQASLRSPAGGAAQSRDRGGRSKRSSYCWQARRRWCCTRWLTRMWSLIFLKPSRWLRLTAEWLETNSQNVPHPRSFGKQRAGAWPLNKEADQA